ncbi:MAG: hypothetical protein IKM30_04680 [Oscillospiraceae bacterium]|nr:hypothetical protein [Oscillospiraceae bacterium]
MYNHIGLQAEQYVLTVSGDGQQCGNLFLEHEMARIDRAVAIGKEAREHAPLRSCSLFCKEIDSAYVSALRF